MAQKFSVSGCILDLEALGRVEDLQIVASLCFTLCVAV